MKKLFCFVILTGFIATAFAQNSQNQSLDHILAGIEELEGNKDPKCYATASRLEDFMYGTPLTDQARYEKNKLQKRLAGIVWRNSAGDAGNIESKDISKAFSEIISFKEKRDGTHLLTFPNKTKISINPTDVRQYGNVAYSLRAILAVQQDSLINPDESPLPPLSPEALDILKQQMDLATLALLQEADAWW